MKTIIFPFLIFCFRILSTDGQQLPKTNLEGILTADGQKITFILKCNTLNNRTSCEIYIPEQLIYAKKAGQTIIRGDSVFIHFKDFQAEYAGKILYDSLYINGRWVQRGKSFPLILNFLDDEQATSFDRPQEPKAPFPYIEKELTIPNKKSKFVLSGTLTLPDTNNIYPLVILISGSGPQNRNEELVGHKPFLVIADYLTRQGMAVFRYDDRGTGNSTGNFGAATTQDFTDDALAVVSYFKKYPFVNPKNIGLIGHSEGGIIAMASAAKNKKDIEFIVSMAGPGVNIIDLLLRQSEDIMRASGAGEELIEITRSVNFQLYNLALTEPNADSLMKKMSGFLAEATSNLSEKEIEDYGFSYENIRLSSMQLFSPWMKYFLSIKPYKYISKIKCPVLAINGTLDLQVAADENLEAIERYLTEGGNRNFKIVKLQGLNHLFQEAEKGTISEYMLNSETISQSALNCITDFIKTHQ